MGHAPFTSAHVAIPVLYRLPGLAKAPKASRVR